MAHFCKINSDGIVEQVIVIDNKDCGDLDFPDSEPIGQAFIKSIGLDGIWRQTSYNSNFRSKYSGIGDKYDAELDEFVSPVVEAPEPAPKKAK